MKRYTEQELAEVLRLHSMWLRNEPGGVRADLSMANLSGACLSDANLSRANLSVADLSRANLSGASLIGANLSMANLSRTNLSRTNLSKASLIGANLSGASLIMANLSMANLSGANLSGANLRKARLDNTILPAFQIVPETGSFDGWKKLSDGHIAHLRIPACAGRVSSTGRKCRAEYVEVIDIYTPMGKKVPRSTEVGGRRDTGFMYTPGKVVRPDKWDPDTREECTHGIHFFLTRKEAEEYRG